VNHRNVSSKLYLAIYLLLFVLYAQARKIKEDDSFINGFQENSKTFICEFTGKIKR